MCVREKEREREREGYKGWDFTNRLQCLVIMTVNIITKNSKQTDNGREGERERTHSVLERGRESGCTCSVLSVTS